MIASVLVEYSIKSLNKVFDYAISSDIKNLKVGHKVIVEFGKSEVEGFVLRIHNNIDKSISYKKILKIVDSEFCLNNELLILGKKMSKSLVCNLISCYQCMLPKALKASVKNNINKKYEFVLHICENIDVNEYKNNNKRNVSEIKIIDGILSGKYNRKDYNINSVKNLIKKGIIFETKKEVYRMVESLIDKNKDIKLTSFQLNAFNDIIKSNFDKFLLYGVTGSGKTEVYIELIKCMIRNHKNVIVLVPEISLTPQIVSRFKSVFKDNIAIFHSALSEGEKYDQYREIMRGEVSVVVGARSAIFMPIDNIGLIIVDECQSSTYKQDNNPKYNAIDIAFERAKFHNAKVVMGSATPSLEQFARAKKGVYKLVTLSNRISGKFPIVELIDMEKEAKKHNYIISDKLDFEIRKTLSSGNQVIILLNRRGYSTFLSCSNCGYVYKCPNCDISLTYHKSSDVYTCHYCGYRKYSDKVCPSCHQSSIKDLGLGTEKLEQMLYEKYGVPVLRMDADTTSYKNAHQKLIGEFSSGKYKILVGTQMISKGLNFEKASLVGIINADASLALPDFRSGEKTYELLSQTAGRVGRYDIEGKVLIQTYNLDNYVYKCVKENDFEKFYNEEMKIRKILKYPPYIYICNINIISSDYELASKVSGKVKRYLDGKLDNNFTILGPSMANIFRMKNNYYFSIIIKYKDSINLINVLNELNEVFNEKKVKLDININI